MTILNILNLFLLMKYYKKRLDYISTNEWRVDTCHEKKNPLFTCSCGNGEKKEIKPKKFTGYKVHTNYKVFFMVMSHCCSFFSLKQIMHCSTQRLPTVLPQGICTPGALLVIYKWIEKPLLKQHTYNIASVNQWNDIKNWNPNITFGVNNFSVNNGANSSKLAPSTLIK